ncbi:ImmA/IrrE family metallo-endopeptidase [Listeria booriae]|uniref:ImmA/IrrE family metallo-endopeptidase n=1 Tax=Listeria booriae TaxID=1552123 RepID=A0A842B982_9LIST|nr:ArdC-like ssDNA-binding domain-containing protein [Listeria booriae]MBC1798452.1 ImmA/IrrE family metallo-endopeptidase [Listeria booriae]
MKKTTYQVKSKEEKQEEIQTLMQGMYDKMERYTESVENVRELLTFMGRFHRYSSRNQQLIQAQFPHAQAVGSFQFFKEKGFSVRKGEKGSKIFVPVQVKLFQREEEWIQVSQAKPEEKARIKAGELPIQSKTHFKLGTVFDVSQTNAKASDYPKIYPNNPAQEYSIQGDVTAIQEALERIAQSQNIQVRAVGDLGALRGNFVQSIDLATNQIKKTINLNPRNTPTENLRVFIHELTHNELHSYDRIQEEKKKDNPVNYTSEVKELQAEMSAYIVCQHIGMDTEKESLPYIAEWTQNGEKIEDKLSVLDEVRKVSSELIEKIDAQMENAPEKERDITVAQVQEKEEIEDVKKNAPTYYRLEKTFER